MDTLFNSLFNRISNHFHNVYDGRFIVVSTLSDDADKTRGSISLHRFNRHTKHGIFTESVTVNIFEHEHTVLISCNIMNTGGNTDIYTRLHPGIEEITTVLDNIILANLSTLQLERTYTNPIDTLVTEDTNG